MRLGQRVMVWTAAACLLAGTAYWVSAPSAYRATGTLLWLSFGSSRGWSWRSGWSGADRTTR